MKWIRIGAVIAVLAAAAAAAAAALLLASRDSTNRSANPPVDTPAHARRFLHQRGALGQIDYLLGTVRQLRPVWKAYAILPAVDTGDSDVHSADVRIFDRNGEWVSTLHPAIDLTPDNVAHDISTALRRSS